MPLQFNGAWRFNPPADGVFCNREIPDEALTEILQIIGRLSTQGDVQDILEHFKGYFCRAAGTTHVRSSNASWAETDLWTYARHAARNAPMFIEALFDACESFRQESAQFHSLDVGFINDFLARRSVGYHIDPPHLQLRDNTQTLIEVPQRPPTLTENALDILNTSLARSEELLSQGRGREAVQEILWLLETVSTAFRGAVTATGTVEGNYFNRIVGELRTANRGTVLDQVLTWVSALHGYLSSPTGGGVRHGLELAHGIAIDNHTARLFCNLVRSYLSFLLTEHERLRASPARP